MEQQTLFTGELNWSLTLEFPTLNIHLLTFYLIFRFPFVCISIGLTIDKVPTVGVVYNPIIEEVMQQISCTSYQLGLISSMRAFFFIYHLIGEN